MSRFLTERYKELRVYKPGEQPADYSKFIKLNTNESPYPPSKLVIEAINSNEIEKLNLYPPLETESLKSKLAVLYGISRENIFLSNGSDEILSFAFLAFCSNGVRVAFSDITYGFYKVYSRLYGCDDNIIPLNSDFSLRVSDYVGLNENIVIANPNAPTGLYLPVADIEEIVKSNKNNLVIIDEAYIDFGGESSARLIEEYDNLLVVQTFSKSRSLAGARLGFAIGQKDLIDDLNRIKYSTNPYNINRLTILAGEAALDDSGYYKECCEKITKSRIYLTEKLKEMGFVVLNSKANFIFTKPFGITASDLYLKLKNNGILIRYFKQSRIEEYVRISIGTQEQTERLLFEIERLI
ncbi:MAG: Histidinol-phosphate aminotransferase [Firmicutes bacterium ADurb.Bin300]|nr:MAG: Histidinol-phosphate aminotransferase [Firmicutes bacterium ADurb.Bin300]